MMINKRLIGTVPDSKPYIAGNVALQWLSLLSNAGMIFSFAWFLQQLLEGAAAPRTLALPLAAGLAAVLVRGICTAGAGRMSFLAARSVKRTLRRSIYEKLLRLGPAYSQNVATSEAVQLAAEGVHARVINIHTIKPLDEEIVLKAAKECGKVITAEEHNVIGGLGEAVCAVLSEKQPTPVRRVGVQDVFGCSGPAWDLLKKFGLDAATICKTAHEMLGK